MSNISKPMLTGILVLALVGLGLYVSDTKMRTDGRFVPSSNVPAVSTTSVPAQPSTTSAPVLPPQSGTKPPITSAKPPCKISGCSAQICADEEMVSTCEYRESYACYKTARCERQANGACGWSDTPELRLCLANAQ